MNKRPLQPQNMFASRWLLNDKQWMLERHQQWLTLENNLLIEWRIKKKDIHYYRDFFLYGTEFPDWNINSTEDVIDLDIEQIPAYLERPELRASLRFALTPQDSVAQMREFFIAQPPKHYETMVNFAAFGGPTIFAEKESFFSDNKQKQMIKALLPLPFTEPYCLPPYSQKVMGISAQRFIWDFEQNCRLFLIKSWSKPNDPIVYIVEHYISALNYLVNSGQAYKHQKDFIELLPYVLNFVDPLGNAINPSSAAGLAKKLKAFYLCDNAPVSVKQFIAQLNPSGFSEVTVGSVDEMDFSYPSFEGKPMHNAWSAPEPRVVEGVPLDKAISAFTQAARDLLLLESDFDWESADSVDIAPALSEEMVKFLGYQQGEEIKSLRFETWFKSPQKFSHYPEAKWGIELFTLPNKVTNDSVERPVLLIWPKLSAHFKKYYPTEALYLIERQLRRLFKEYSGVNMIAYDDEDYGMPFSEYNPEQYFKDPAVSKGFWEIVKTDEEQDIGFLTLATEPFAFREL